jgi:hypothetical protein
VCAGFESRVGPGIERTFEALRNDIKSRRCRAHGLGQSHARTNGWRQRRLPPAISNSHDAMLPSRVRRSAAQDEIGGRAFFLQRTLFFKVNFAKSWFLMATLFSQIKIPCILAHVT